MEDLENNLEFVSNLSWKENLISKQWISPSGRESASQQRAPVCRYSSGIISTSYPLCPHQLWLNTTNSLTLSRKWLSFSFPIDSFQLPSDCILSGQFPFQIGLFVCLFVYPLNVISHRAINIIILMSYAYKGWPILMSVLFTTKIFQLHKKVWPPPRFVTSFYILLICIFKSASQVRMAFSTLWFVISLRVPAPFWGVCSVRYGRKHNLCWLTRIVSQKQANLVLALRHTKWSSWNHLLVSDS